MADKPQSGLFVALAAAQAEMTRAAKDTNNPHFKSRYADLASVMDACMGPLNRHGIAVLQMPVTVDGKRYLRTAFVHGASGEREECDTELICAKNDMQGFGSAMTYARRYGLMAMAGVAPDDDDGNAAASGMRNAPQSQTRELRDDAEAGAKAVEARAAAEKHAARCVEAAGKLRAADTLDELKAMFASLYTHNREIADDADVIRAKEERKAELAEQQDEAA